MSPIKQIQSENQLSAVLRVELLSGYEQEVLVIFHRAVFISLTTSSSVSIQDKYGIPKASQHQLWESSRNHKTEAKRLGSEKVVERGGIIHVTPPWSEQGAR